MGELDTSRLRMPANLEQPRCSIYGYWQNP